MLIAHVNLLNSSAAVYEIYVLMRKVLIKIWTLQACPFVGSFLWQLAIKAMPLGIKEEYFKKTIFTVIKGAGGEKDFVSWGSPKEAFCKP